MELPGNEYLSMSPWSAADRQDGERQARVGLACHSFAANDVSMTDPDLCEIFGMQPGFVARFDW